MKKPSILLSRFFSYVMDAPEFEFQTFQIASFQDRFNF